MLERMIERRKRRLVLNEAAAWFLKIRDNEMSEAEFAKWRSWLSLSSEHARAFDDVAKLWNECDALDSIQENSFVQENGIRETTSLTGHSSLRWGFGWIGSVGVRPAMATGMAAIVFVLGAAGIRLWSESEITAAPVFETVVAEHRAIELEDGSKVILGAMSRISAHYSETRREVILHNGEALFEVEKNPNRPFAVIAGVNTVEAIGTAFNVNIGGSDVTVTVVEGKVQIGPISVSAKQRLKMNNDIFGNDQEIQPIVLKRSQSVEYTHDGDFQDIEIANLELATSWRYGRMNFMSEPLKDVIVNVNRYTTREIVIVDSFVGDLQFTGTVFEGEIKDWLAGLEKAFPIRIIHVDDNTTLVIGKEDADGEG